jgi:hypothetical protein
VVFVTETLGEYSDLADRYRTTTAFDTSFFFPLSNLAVTDLNPERCDENLILGQQTKAFNP